MRDLAYELTNSSEGIAIVTPEGLPDLPHLVRKYVRLYENRKPAGKSQAWVEPGCHLGLILGGSKGGGEKGPLSPLDRYSVAKKAEVDHKSLTTLANSLCRDRYPINRYESLPSEAGFRYPGGTFTVALNLK